MGHPFISEYKCYAKHFCPAQPLEMEHLFLCTLRPKTVQAAAAQVVKHVETCQSNIFNMAIHWGKPNMVGSVKSHILAISNKACTQHVAFTYKHVFHLSGSRTATALHGVSPLPGFIATMKAFCKRHGPEMETRLADEKVTCYIDNQYTKTYMIIWSWWLIKYLCNGTRTNSNHQHVYCFSFSY